MNTVGWLFRRNDVLVWVFLQDRDTAHARAVDELGGEPKAEVQELSADVARFFGAQSGSIVRARVFQ